MMIKEDLLNLISHLDANSPIEFAIKQGGGRYCSLRVMKFEAISRGSSFVLEIYSASPSDHTVTGTVESLRNVVNSATASIIESIKLIGIQKDWAWATKMTYPLFLTVTDEGLPLVVVRCRQD